MKKYLKPEVEYVSFYSAEDVADVLSLPDGALGELPSVFIGTGDNDCGWT